MKSKLIITLFSFFIGMFIFQDADAQRRTNPTNNNAELEEPRGRKIFGNDKWFIGGNAGANFNRNFGFVELSPLLGYMLTETLAVGAGPVYQYIGSNGTGLHTYGIRGLARQDIFNNFFLQGEFANLTIRSGGQKCNYRRLPLGGGLKFNGNGRTYFYGALLYDLFYNSDQGVGATNCFVIDDTGTPIVYRLGFSFGL